MNPRWSEDALSRTAAPTGRGQGAMPMVVGGLMVAVSLLAFLFYDGRPASRDVETTGSTRPAITEPAKPAPSTSITTPTRP